MGHGRTGGISNNSGSADPTIFLGDDALITTYVNHPPLDNTNNGNFTMGTRL